MKFIVKLLTTLSLVVTPSAALAQQQNQGTATVKVPLCLQYRETPKVYIPCTGVVPVDSVSGNALSWQDLFKSVSISVTGGGTGGPGVDNSVVTGQTSTRALPVQNADGSKMASDAQLANLVTAAGLTNTRLSAINTTLGTPFQAGGLIGNTFFGARLQDSAGAALGTVANPLIVSGSGLGGGGGGSTITAAIGAASTSAVPVQGADGKALATNETLAGLFKAGQNIGTVTAIENPVAVTGTFYQATQPVSAAALPLPTGAATAAKQDAVVAAIADLGTPLQANGTIGNAFFGARLQDATGTALGTSANPIFVSGGGGGGGSSTITATAGTSSPNAVPIQSVNGAELATNTTVNSLFKAGQSIGNTAFGATQSGTWNVGVTGLPALPAGTSTIGKVQVDGTAAVTQSGTWNVGTVASITNPVAVTGTFYQATQPVSATALPLPTGAATAAKQDTLLAALGSPVQAGSFLSNVIQATATDRGAVVGTSALTLMASNALRKGFSVQNQSTTASCYINGTAAATADFHSLIIGPGGYFEPDHHVGTGAISIICTAASTSVYAREW